jgi:hypothetical protein
MHGWHASPRPACAIPTTKPPASTVKPTDEAACTDARTPAQRQHDALNALVRGQLGDPKLGQHNGLPVTVIVSTTCHSFVVALVFRRDCSSACSERCNPWAYCSAASMTAASRTARAALPISSAASAASMWAARRWLQQASSVWAAVPPWSRFVIDAFDSSAGVRQPGNDFERRDGPLKRAGPLAWGPCLEDASPRCHDVGARRVRPGPQRAIPAFTGEFASLAMIIAARFSGVCPPTGR